MASALNACFQMLLKLRAWLESLKRLDLNHCSNLETFPEIMEDMQELKDLDLRGTAIKELPSSVQRIKRLRSLDLSNCKDLETLPHTIYDLEFLEDLIAHGCPKLKKFPRNLGNLKGLRSLEKLDLSYCDGMEGAIFSDIGQFFKPRELNIIHCKLLHEIPELPSTLREIDAHDCTALETLFSPSSPLWSSLLKLLKSATQDSECDTQTGISKINITGSGGIPRWVLQIVLQQLPLGCGLIIGPGQLFFSLDLCLLHMLLYVCLLY